MKTNNKGFTLVETVIALSVTSVLIFIVINFMTNSIVEYSLAGSRGNLLNEAQIALDVVSNDTRLSGNADANNRWPDVNAPGAPDNEFSWASDDDTLILATAVEDTDGNIVFADPALYISQKNNNIYYLQEGSLYKRTIAYDDPDNSAKTSCPPDSATSECPADKKLLNNVQEFEVQYYNDQNQQVTPTDARSIELYVKLQKNEYGRPVSVEYSTRMVFRND